MENCHDGCHHGGVLGWGMQVGQGRAAGEHQHLASKLEGEYKNDNLTSPPSLEIV